MKAKKVSFCGLLTALAIVLSLAERLFPLDAVVPVPGVKLGLANAGDPVCADKTFGAGRVFYFGMPRDDFLGTDGERDRVSVFPAWGAAFLGCHVPAAAAGRAVLLSAGCQCGRGGGT